VYEVMGWVWCGDDWLIIGNDWLINGLAGAVMVSNGWWDNAD
jgi:hypothetical protein